MELTDALIFFFSGIVAHAFGIRIFGIWNKALLYRTTFIKCLTLLRLSEDIAKDLFKAVDPTEKKDIEKVLEYWQKLSLRSLKNAIPDGTWRQISIEDWDQAMKILATVEKERR